MVACSIEHRTSSCGVASYCSTRCTALAFSPWRPRSNSSRAPGQLPYPASGHHGCRDDCLVSAARGVMALLRLDGDCRFGDWRICLVQARSQRGKKSTRTQVLGSESGPSLQDLRALGVQRHCYPGHAAPSRADGSVSVRSRCYAISGEKVPDCAHARSTLEIHDHRLLGGSLRKKNHWLHYWTWTSCGGRSSPGSGNDSCGSFLFPARIVAE